MSVRIEDGYLSVGDADALAAEFLGRENPTERGRRVVLADLFLQLMTAAEGASFGGATEVAPRWDFVK
jgi:hypothetical protein